MQEVLSPTPEGEYVGSAIVQEVFNIGGTGNIAGSKCRDGIIKKGSNVRVMRGDKILIESKVRTLRNFKVSYFGYLKHVVHIYFSIFIACVSHITNYNTLFLICRSLRLIPSQLVMSAVLVFLNSKSSRRGMSLRALYSNKEIKGTLC